MDELQSISVWPAEKTGAVDLKIDESNNTKIKITVGAISGKISDE